MNNFIAEPYEGVFNLRCEDITADPVEAMAKSVVSL